MTERDEEWGPWIDGTYRGSQVTPETWVHVQWITGGEYIGPAGGGGKTSDGRQVVLARKQSEATPMLRHRFRRPRALRDLIALARDARPPADRHREVCEEHEAATPAPDWAQDAKEKAR